MRRLLDRYLLSGIAYVGEMGGGTGGGTPPAAGGNGIIEPGETGNNSPPLFGQDDDGEGESLDFLEAFKPEGSDDDEDFNGDIDDTNRQPYMFQDMTQERVAALENEVKETIKRINFPANLIPEDFDPSNREQLAAMLTRSTQASVRAAMNVVFKPVQAAIAHMMQQLPQMMDSKIESAGNGLRARSALEELVPEINDSKWGPMVRMMDDTLRKNGKKARERAQTIRKTLNQMGAKSTVPANGSRRRSTGVDGMSGGLNTGTAALDNFFGVFAGNAKK